MENLINKIEDYIDLFSEGAYSKDELLVLIEQAIKVATEVDEYRNHLFI